MWIGNAGHYFALLVIVLLALPGCGDDGPAMATVAGTITLDGETVETGAIMFVPADGKAQTTGGVIKGGRYSVEVPPGLMKVSISSPRVIGEKKIYATPDSPTMPVTEEAVPARYNKNTELKFQVEPGENQKDFSLNGDSRG